MTAPRTGRRGPPWRHAATRLAPWAVLALALLAATAPAWRPLAFGVSLGLDDLLQLRCRVW